MTEYVQAGDAYKEELPAKTSFDVAKDIGRTAKALSGYQCCTLQPTGLTINPDAPLKSWQRLIRDLDSMWYAGEVKELLLKFYVGDAINQGCEIYGESHAQAFGDGTHWSLGYLNNITWTCRKLPPEHRCLRLHWRFHQDLAPLSYDEQAYYLSLAKELYDSGNKEWHKEVQAAIQDEKCRQLLKQVPSEDREYWREMIERHEPTWTKLRDWINGTRPVPPTSIALPDYISREIEKIQNRVDITPDVKDIIVSAMFDLADNIKDKVVEL